MKASRPTLRSANGWSRTWAPRTPMILRNHGTLAVGGTVAECFLRLYFLERACDAQVAALSAGRDGLYNAAAGHAGKGRQGKHRASAWSPTCWPGRRCSASSTASTRAIATERGLGRMPAAAGGVPTPPEIMSAAFSAIITVAALVLPDTRRGITEASTTRRPEMPMHAQLRDRQRCAGHRRAPSQRCRPGDKASEPHITRISRAARHRFAATAPGSRSLRPSTGCQRRLRGEQPRPAQAGDDGSPDRVGSRDNSAGLPGAIERRVPS